MTSSLPVAQNAVKEFKVDLRWMSAICFNSELCFYATGKGKDKVSNKNTTNFRLKVTFFFRLNPYDLLNLRLLLFTSVKLTES